MFLGEVGQPLNEYFSYIKKTQADIKNGKFFTLSFLRTSTVSLVVKLKKKYKYKVWS